MNYLPQLTVTRFIAAFMVVAFHFGQGAWPLSLSPLIELVREGGLAVGFFFVLSGFVMTWVYKEKIERKNWKKGYTVARIARIVPLYWASSVLALLLGMWLRDAYPRGLAVILQSLFVHAWVPGAAFAVNFPSWSVSVEVMFYIVFPFLLPWLVRKKTGSLVLITLGVWLVTQVAYVTLPSWTPEFQGDQTGDFALRFPLWHLNQFLVGMCGALLFIRYQKSFTNLWAYLSLLLSVVGLVLICVLPNGLLPYAANGLLAPLFILFILGLAALPPPAARIFGNSAFIFLGEISYAIYLLQCPVYYVWEAAMGRGGVTGNWFWLYFLSLMAVSALSWKLLEKPAQNWLRKRR